MIDRERQAWLEGYRRRRAEEDSRELRWRILVMAAAGLIGIAVGAVIVLLRG